MKKPESIWGFYAGKEVPWVDFDNALWDWSDNEQEAWYVSTQDKKDLLYIDEASDDNDEPDPRNMLLNID